MRSLLLLLMLAASSSLRAQVMNGSFESGGSPDLSGWSFTCECGNPSPSANTPGGTGSWSLDLTAENYQCPCEVTFDLYQDLPWLTPGVWTLSYWIMGHDGNGPPPGVVVAYRTGMGFPPLSNFDAGVTDTDWSHHEDLFYWDGIWPAQDSLLLMISGGAAMDGERHPLFDDIQLTAFSTTVADLSREGHPAFRPNPATDKLWVDLSDAPGSVSLRDAQGRCLAAPGFFFSGHTLELDVAGLAPGLHLLVITTAKESMIVRFVKT